MRKVVLGVVAIVLGWGAKTAVAAPAWCNAEGVTEPRSSSLRSALSGGEPFGVLPDLVGVTCWPDSDARSRMKEIDAARARWSKALDLTEADWADVAVWASAPQSSRGDWSPRLDHSKKYAWSSMGPIDQFAGIYEGLPQSENWYSKYTYFVDALGPRLTETGRLAYILKACLNKNVGSSVVEWAICMPDLERLDRKKLAAELRKDTTRTGFDRMLVRNQLFSLDARVKAMQPEWNKAKAQDPAYAKMFEIAAATRKEWDQLWKAEEAALDLMRAMDDVRETSSRKLREGCEAKTWPAVQAAIGKVEAKRFEGIAVAHELDSWLAHALGIVANSPQGWLALAAHHLCVGRNDEQPVSNTIGAVLMSLPGYRGPRLASHTAILNAGLELDDASAKIDMPGADHRPRFEGSAARAYIATAAKVQVKGDKATISFHKKFERQQSCAKSKGTNRISRITASGDVIYESVCLKWESYTVDTTRDPHVVDARTAAGLKPGMNAMLGGPIVHAAWVKGKKAPASILGVSLK